MAKWKKILKTNHTTTYVDAETDSARLLGDKDNPGCSLTLKIGQLKSILVWTELYMGQEDK